MACDVTVDVESGGPYRARDRVRGTVRVAAFSRTEVARATVRAGWRTSGECDVDAGRGTELEADGFVVEADGNTRSRSTSTSQTVLSASRERS